MKRALPLLAVQAALATPPVGHAFEPGSGVTAAAVLPDAEIDGRRVRVEQLTAPLPAAEAASRIAAGWRAVGDPVIGLRLGPWHLVSRLASDRYETAQLREAAIGGSEGFLSSWFHPRRTATQAPRAPWWPASARLLRTVASRDGARHAVTWIGRTDLAPSAFRRLVAARLTAGGWSVPAGEVPAASARPPAHALTPAPVQAYRDGATLVVVIEPRADGAAFVAQQLELRP